MQTADAMTMRPLLFRQNARMTAVRAPFRNFAGLRRVPATTKHRSIPTAADQPPIPPRLDCESYLGTPHPAITARIERRVSLLLFLRGQHHDHLAPFHLRHLLDLTDFVKVGAQPLEHAHTDFLVSHFAATETQRDFRLVAVFEEANEIAELDVVIAIIGTRAEFDFLDLDDLLL